MLLALELDDGCNCCSAIVLMEEGGLKGLAWHAFEVPGLYDALGRHDFPEFAVEAVLGAVRVDVGEVPSAAGADVHLFDRHLVFSRSHPVDEELRVRVCPEHCFAGCVETTFYSDFSIVRCRDYGGVRGRLGGFHNLMHNHLAINTFC